jgi:hypothetical protein
VPVPTPVARGVLDSSVRSSSRSGIARRQTAGRARRAFTDKRLRRDRVFPVLRANESNHEVKRIVDHSGAVLTFARHQIFASPR